MYCAKCGKELSSTAKFCSGCGSPVQNTSAESPKEPEKKPIPAETPEVTPIVPLKPEQPAESSVPETVRAAEISTPQAEPSAANDVPQTAPLEDAGISQTVRAAENEMPKTAPAAKTPDKPQSAPAPKAKRPPQSAPKKAKKAASPAACIFSVLLSILLFASLALSSALTLVGNALSQESFEAWLETLDLPALEIPLEEPGTITEIAYKICQEHDENLKLTEKDIEKLIEKSFTQKVVFEIAEEYRAFIVEGEKEDGITAERILEFIEDNESAILKVLHNAGYPASYSFHYDKIAETLEKQIGDQYSIDALDDAYGDILSVSAFLLSPTVLILSWGLCALLLLLILLLNLRSVSNTLVYAGIPAVLVGIVYFAAVLTVLFIFGSNRMSVLYAALQLILRPALLMGIILFNTGIVLLAVKCFVRYFRGKRNT